MMRKLTPLGLAGLSAWSLLTRKSGVPGRLEPRVKRLLLPALVPLALVMSACAVGDPKPPTQPSATGITLNANVYSSIDGPTDYWFVYGAPGDQANWQETTHGTVQIADRDPHPVSQSVTGLQADTVYNWKVCVADQQESPPREVCSKDQVFATVGDFVEGHGTAFTDPTATSPDDFSFSVRSGPHGENPAGVVTHNPARGGDASSVTCLRVNGTDASIGVDGSRGPFLYFFSTGGFNGFGFVSVTPQSVPVTDCPAYQADGTVLFQGDVTVHDAP